ncbi:hypothetical protein FOZ63_007338, partial [Perkinsus olseni]
LRITVDNPSTPLSAFDEANTWTIDLEAAGDGHGSGIVKQAVTEAFKGDESIEDAAVTSTGRWSGNKAVLGKMSLLHIEPSSWIGGATHLLRIFFATEQDVTIGGQVDVVLPPDFTIPTPCEVADLDPRIYAIGPAVPTHRIVGIADGCHSFVAGTSRSAATVGVSARLVAGRRYAFGLKIRNPLGYNTTHQNSWFVYTRDFGGRRMDGSFGSVPLNEGEPTEGQSWGLYQSSSPAEAFNVTVTDLRPYALTFRYARVTVAPIKVPTTFTAAVRITAPQGFLWRNIDSSGFAIHPANHSSGRVVLGYNISAAWPGGVPSVAYGNQLLFPSAVYSDAHTYGFEADVEVPERNPVAGYNEWRIEVGWNGNTSESRPFVGVFSSPPVRSLSDAYVGYTYNAVGKENVLTFRIRLESHLFGPGGIVAEMPLGFSSVPYCTPLGVNNGPSPFPSDVHCAYMPLISPFPAISIIGSRTNGIPPGLYEWRLVT